jgi:hypothetical protein
MTHNHGRNWPPVWTKGIEKDATRVIGEVGELRQMHFRCFQSSYSLCLLPSFLLASFLQRQQEDQHLQRCKHREMVCAAVHIYWGRRQGLGLAPVM